MQTAQTTRQRMSLLNNKFLNFCFEIIVKIFSLCYTIFAKQTKYTAMGVFFLKIVPVFIILALEFGKNANSSM